MSNIFCIGDVHGCFFTLEQLLKKLPNDAKLIFTGDLCDKGLYSNEVIDFVISEGHEVIQGNHEALMIKFLLEAIEDPEKHKWSSVDMYGGMNTVKSYNGDIDTAKKHIEFVNNLDHYKIIDNYFLTHGFGHPYFNQRDESVWKIRSNRLHNPYEDWEDYQDYEHINIFGHCDFDEVEVGNNYFGIDTGAVYGNKLTAIELGSHKIIQQNTSIKDIKY